MSKLNCKDVLKLEQQAASVHAMRSPSRGARGDSPRLTPSRIFTSHLDSIIKNKEKEQDAKNPSRNRIKTEVKVEEETDAVDPTPSDLHLLEERQEPYGAECEDSSFGGVKEEIRIHLTTEIHLIPLPGEENSTALVDDTLTGLVDDTLSGEDDVSNSFQEQPEEPSSPHSEPQGSQKKNAMEELDSSLDLQHKSSKSSKKRRKKAEESPDVHKKRSPTKEVRKHSRKSSRRCKRSSQNEEPDRPPTSKHHSTRRSCNQTKEEVHDSEHKVYEENDKDLISSSSTSQSLKDSKRKLNHSFSSVSPLRYDKRSSSERRPSPIRSCSSSDFSTPVKTENFTSTAVPPVHQLRTLHPLSKMSSSEIYVDVAVSSESEDELVEHEVFTVRDQQREMETPSAMSSRSGSGSGCSKPSTALDFIPFCAPRSAYVTRREGMCHLPPMTGSPYSPSWQHPHNSGYEQYSATPPPAMHQGVFEWQQHYEGHYGNPYDSIASLVQYPPPPHPNRPLFPNVPHQPLPPGAGSDYPIRRYSVPSTEEHQQHPVNRHSLPSQFPGCTESSTQPLQLPPPMPVVDRRFSCLQNLHNPPKPNIFGYQLIGDSMLVRFAQQILGQPPILLESLRFIGYCVSGQRIGDLLKRLKSGFYHVNDKVVLMIGTNDLVKNSQAEQMIYELRKVLEHLCTKAEKIVVLTLPPIPRYEHFTHHWIRLNKYNDFIKTLNNAGPPPAVSHIDICNLYCSKRISKCRMDCFELKFSESSNRKDLIHLNRKGLELVKEQLYKLLP